MNRNKSVMKPRSNLIGLVGFILNPVLNIITKLFERGWNLVRINADVLAAVAKLSRPFPNAAEHAVVQDVEVAAA